MREKMYNRVLVRLAKLLKRDPSGVKGKQFIEGLKDFGLIDTTEEQNLWNRAERLAYPHNTKG